MTVEHVAIDSLRANSYNPNRQSAAAFQLLLSSIKTDGCTQPIVITADNAIVDGEHRWRACKSLGYETIPVVRTTMSAAQARVATLRLNRAVGREDAGLAADVLRELSEMGALDWAQEELALDDLEVDRILSDLTSEAANLASFSDPADDPRDAKRLQEDRLSRAKGAEVKGMAAVDRKIYRLQLILVNEDACLVREVLGSRPAQKIVELCREAAHTTPCGDAAGVLVPP